MKVRHVALLALLTVPALALPPPKPPQPKPSAPKERPAGDQTAIEPAPAPSPTEAAPVQERATAITASILVKVVHPDEVRSRAIAKAAAFGGFAVLVSDAELQLKVPPQHLPELLDLVASSGIVIDKSLQRRDRTEHIVQLEAKWRSKQEIFQRLRKFLDDSPVEATLKIERSMTQLVAELEQIKGELEVERAATTHALLVVRFDYHRQGRVTYVRSPFEWLNTVDLDRFLSDSP